MVSIAVLGHVEHVTLGRVPEVPVPGGIAHLSDVHVFPGGGGGVAFFQLAKSDAQLHLYSAIGNDEAGAFVEAKLRECKATLHLARRPQPHTRDLVMIDPEGERTIVVVGEPHHPAADDPLDYGALASCDVAYFTAQDPEVLRLARAARQLIVTARRRASLLKSGVKAEVVVGSRFDPREVSTRADYPVPPDALVMTEGAAGGTIETADGTVRFDAPRLEQAATGAYGAGDSFAGALTYYLAMGADVRTACARAARHGAAVTRGLNPIPIQLPLRSAGSIDAR